jgi:hypothetical protein
MRPYLQGALDRCCGIYSIINATKLVAVPFTYYDASWTFQQCFDALESRKHTQTAVCYGVGILDLLFLIKTVVQPNYPIVYTRPFAKAAKTPMTAYWEACMNFIRQERRAIIIAVTNKEWSHWTVVWKATEKQLFLFDSGKRKIINRSSCSIYKLTDDNPVILFPSVTIFLSASDAA